MANPSLVEQQAPTLPYMEQNLNVPRVTKVVAASISAGTPPAALEINGANFGTDFTLVKLEIGANLIAAITTSFADGVAKFDLAGWTGFANGTIAYCRIRRRLASGRDLYSLPFSIPVVT